MKLNLKYLAFLAFYGAVLFLTGALLGTTTTIASDAAFVAAYAPLVSGFVRTALVICGFLVVAYALSSLVCLAFWRKSFRTLRAEDRTKDGWPDNGYSRTDKIMLASLFATVILAILLLFGGLALQLCMASFFGVCAFAVILSR